MLRRRLPRALAALAAASWLALMIVNTETVLACTRTVFATMGSPPPA